MRFSRRALHLGLFLKAASYHSELVVSIQRAACDREVLLLILEMKMNSLVPCMIGVPIYQEIVQLMVKLLLWP